MTASWVWRAGPAMAKPTPQTGLGGGDVAFHHNEDVSKKVILVSPFVKGFAGELLLLLLLLARQVSSTSIAALIHPDQPSAAVSLCMLAH